jgi:hypothetical protein
MADMNKDIFTQTQPGKLDSSIPSRRRVVVAGAAGAVLASLKSGSALAGGVCVGPSAFTSITLNPATSNRPDQSVACNSHGYWKNHENAWPIPIETRVLRVFCASALTEGIGISTTTTMLTVLKTGGGGDRPFARNLISAYLDARKNGNSVFKASDIQLMWSLVFCGGTFSVNGTAWNRTHVEGFLKVLVGGDAAYYE